MFAHRDWTFLIIQARQGNCLHQINENENAEVI